ncbi:MAG: hypothetical protein ABIT71_22535 [Vicinamibacteraceae bacterium]
MRYRIRLAVAIGAFVATAACQPVLEYPFREQYAALRAIKIGATEAQIRSALGNPDFVHPKGTPPAVYCLPGRACTDRNVTGRLLVYVRGKPSAYYFLDVSGHVEHVYVGGA